LRGVARGATCYSIPESLDFPETEKIKRRRRRERERERERGGEGEEEGRKRGNMR
jgi:hypothetical protein